LLRPGSGSVVVRTLMEFSQARETNFSQLTNFSISSLEVCWSRK